MRRRAIQRGIRGVLAALGVIMLAAAPALACAGLVGPGGSVRLERTATLAAYRDGVEHYVTAFTYRGGGARFGSIVPLPGVPTEVVKGGDWTLQRLALEVQPPPESRVFAADAEAAGGAEELLKTQVDALDITILRGGGQAVGNWAREHGFGLTPDAPEVLDFYARRSPIFMAASYNPSRAQARDQQLGDGTPVHLTIPTDNPWVPLRILGLGLAADERVEADVFLLTEQAPSLLPAPRPGISLERNEEASEALLTDLRSDRGMGWLPAKGMWLSYLKLDTTAGELTHDLAVDVTGESPSPAAAGLQAATEVSATDVWTPDDANRILGLHPWQLGLLAVAVLAAVAGGVALWRWDGR
jgi:hypothetical protein